MPEETRVPEGWREAEVQGLMHTIGPLLSFKDARGRRFGLATDSRHANAVGRIHGGVITSLMDQVLAYEAWRAANRRPTVTVQMDTRFLAAARPGDFIEATAQVVQATRSMLFVEAQMVSGEKPLARASAVLKIVAGGDSR
ncbi:MAG: PaaI family thioesterase [Vannielia sp.]|uniref:PaaI family thioesterase n=1 Tax=Vannielia sp. TaxID=2813045 RepID=UPI003B8B8F3C